MFPVLDPFIRCSAHARHPTRRYYAPRCCIPSPQHSITPYTLAEREVMGWAQHPCSRLHCKCLNCGPRCLAVCHATAAVSTRPASVASGGSMHAKSMHAPEHALPSDPFGSTNAPSLTPLTSIHWQPSMPPSEAAAANSMHAAEARTADTFARPSVQQQLVEALHKTR